jgi:hypothetical protein
MGAALLCNQFAAAIRCASCPRRRVGAPESNAARSWRLAQHDRGNHSVDASERSALSERGSPRAPAPAQQRNWWLVETRRSPWRVVVAAGFNFPPPSVQCGQQNS